jgi:hypothetical protein
MPGTPVWLGGIVGVAGGAAPVVGVDVGADDGEVDDATGAAPETALDGGAGEVAAAAVV